jgi:hypothetical protein
MTSRLSNIKTSEIEEPLHFQYTSDLCTYLFLQILPRKLHKETSTASQNGERIIEGDLGQGLQVDTTYA